MARHRRRDRRTGDTIGGEIRVESELDYGTVVTVVLPANGKLRAVA